MLQYAMDLNTHPSSHLVSETAVLLRSSLLWEQREYCVPASSVNIGVGLFCFFSVASAWLVVALWCLKLIHATQQQSNLASVLISHIREKKISNNVNIHRGIKWHWDVFPFSVHLQVNRRVEQCNRNSHIQKCFPLFFLFFLYLNPINIRNWAREIKLSFQTTFFFYLSHSVCSALLKVNGALAFDENAHLPDLLLLFIVPQTAEDVC